ncbi:MAG: glucosamine-6-phosphate deaminase [Eubacterium sp.]
MKIYEVENYAALSNKAASIISAQITLKPNCTLGLATGSTPEGLYENLAAWCKGGVIDFSDVHSINLDEYKGLAPDHPQSYRYFMDSHLFNHVNIDKANTHVPNGLEEDADKECARYDALIENSGGIDLQLLGLGHNGHVGFNEPSDAFDNGTHCVELTESTLNANARYFDSPEAQPHYAYTMGIRAILNADKVLLIVSGKAKAQALYDSLCGPITPQVPASILQFHKNLIVVADKEALSLFDKK